MNLIIKHPKKENPHYLCDQRNVCVWLTKVEAHGIRHAKCVVGASFL